MAKLRDLLLSADFLKQAGPENPSQRQLEQDFGSLAYTFLADRAPKLIDYLLGFETVEQEADGSRAVGIFGFKINDVYYYVPVFFINNQIKGMDMLFNKKTNSMVPLQESWIDHILHNNALTLGESAGPSGELAKDFENLNFDFLREPPSAKEASARSGRVRDIAIDGFNTWNLIQEKIASSLDTDNEFKEAFAATIACVQDKGKEIYKYSEDVSDSKLVAFLENTGGPKAVRALANSFSDIKFANAALTFYPSVASLIVNEFNEKLAPKTAEDDVKIVSSITEYTDANDKERKKLVTHGFAIKDIRPSANKSEVFPDDYTQKFSNPSEPGKYDVLLDNGGTTEAWVFLPAQPDAKSVIAFEPETKTTMTVKANKLYVRGDKLEAKTTPYKTAIPLDEIDVSKKYIFINDKLQASSIFSPSSVVSSNSSRTLINGYFDDRYESTSNNYGTAPTWRPEPAIIRDVCKVQLADFASDTLRVVGDKLIVPSDWKALEVNNDYFDNAENRRAFNPGTLLDLDEALFKNAVHKLTVENPDQFGGSYHIYMDSFSEGPFNYKQAAYRLVKHYGLNVDDTYELLKDADVNIKSRRLVKLAQGVGVAMPAPYPETMTPDPYTGALMQSPQYQQMVGEFTGVPELQDPMQRGFNMGGQTESEQENAIDTEVAALLEQAAQTGQRTVFDQGAIAGLTKIYDVSSVIDMYLPDMVKALDRLGRILFLYYWKNLEFTDRYGSEDIANMEDNIRSVFKNYGDLILKLKEKSIDQGANNLV